MPLPHEGNYYQAINAEREISTGAGKYEVVKAGTKLGKRKERTLECGTDQGLD